MIPYRKRRTNPLNIGPDTLSTSIKLQGQDKHLENNYHFYNWKSEITFEVLIPLLTLNELQNYS